MFKGLYLLAWAIFGVELSQKKLKEMTAIKY